MRIKSRNKVNVNFSMSGMTDIVFLLLLFFMLTSTLIAPNALKLLIPDIAGANEVILDKGNFYPHHNLYFITSTSWDMEVLGGLLSSKVALFFIWSYAVRMHGNYLRFQAQYLRKIRLPDPQKLPARLTQSIRAAFRKRDFSVLDTLALQAFELKSLPEFEFVDTRR